jgi:hypothetical protein
MYAINISQIVAYDIRHKEHIPPLTKPLCFIGYICKVIFLAMSYEL